jgi:hypothetical protein
MSDAQVRARVRAYEREEAWAPYYIARERSGPLQAAQRHRAIAQLRQTAEQDDPRREQLYHDAAETRALAEVLDRQAAQLDSRPPNRNVNDAGRTTGPASRPRARPPTASPAAKATRDTRKFSRGTFASTAAHTSTNSG